jgi:hypothetical protein
MAICIKGHYGTNTKRDKSARATESIKQEWKEYSTDLQRGIVHKRPNQLEAIKELHGEGMADRIKRETE